MKRFFGWLGVPISWGKDWLTLTFAESSGAPGSPPKPVRIEEWAAEHEDRILGATIVSCAIFLTLLLAVSGFPAEAGGAAEPKSSEGDRMTVLTIVLIASILGSIIVGALISTFCKRHASKRIVCFVFLAAFAPTLPFIGAANLLFHVKFGLPAVLGWLCLLVAGVLGPYRSTLAMGRYLVFLPCPVHSEPDSCPKNCRMRLRITYWGLIAVIVLTALLAMALVGPE